MSLSKNVSLSRGAIASLIYEPRNDIREARSGAPMYKGDAYMFHEWSFNVDVSVNGLGDPPGVGHVRTGDPSLDISVELSLIHI